jgi:hypothetical protein
MYFVKGTDSKSSALTVNPKVIAKMLQSRHAEAEIAGICHFRCLMS